MFKILIIGFAIIAFNVVLQAWANIYLTRKTVSVISEWKKKLNNMRILRLLVYSFLFLTFLHAIHSLIWAYCLYLIPSIQPDFASFHDIFYYSIVTFTTLGYGDMTISSEWKILSGIEAINGIMLIGWSTALMYSLIQIIYKTLREQNGKQRKN
ncbi:potassium channel family protein [Draconibacterium sediminis]|uniref:potassium channel family protein n=1 Tax=Draconibacterium sediminis TaxID=1544798 RepID=UPI0006986967|nr:potassium channel family protein [Draconibacterium sediminis]